MLLHSWWQEGRRRAVPNCTGPKVQLWYARSSESGVHLTEARLGRRPAAANLATLHTGTHSPWVRSMAAPSQVVWSVLVTLMSQVPSQQVSSLHPWLCIKAQGQLERHGGCPMLSPSAADSGNLPRALTHLNLQPPLCEESHTYTTDRTLLVASQ